MNHNEMVASILATYDSASPEAREAGRAWYPAARKIAQEMADASGVTVPQAIGVIAHLSPRTKWADNIHRAWLVVTTGTCPGLTACTNRAVRAMMAEDPYTTFGLNAHKTRAFFANINGATGRVCVDTWAARVAGVDHVDLGSRKIYNDIEDAYVAAAIRRGIDPRDMQAITWCAIRGTGE